MFNPEAKLTLENAKWLDSIRRYVQDEDSRILDLHNLDLTLEEIKLILEFLEESQVCELDLSYHNLKNQMGSLSKVLSKTKIKKLNVSSCELTLEDVMHVMSILKKLQITDLNISKNKFVLSQPECNKFIAFLRESHLTSLNLRKSVEFINSEDVSCFLHTVCKTSITHLNLDSLNVRNQYFDQLVILLKNLKYSAITHLSLANNFSLSCCVGDHIKFGNSLRNSKLIELDLSYSKFDQTQIKDLFEALAGSRVSSLKLRKYFRRGIRFGIHCLKYTRITRLDLHKTKYTQNELSGTSLVSLQLNDCRLSDRAGVSLMRSLRWSKLEELDVGYNWFKDSTLLELSHCITETAITSLNISDHPYSGCYPSSSAVANLLGALKNSNVSSLKLRWLKLDEEAAEIVFPNLKNTKLTHLDLGSNNLEGGLQSLAAVLKFTALTHLNLKKNFINDEDTKVLAECVKETRVSFLNLGCNRITDSGAVALAISLKGSNILTLKLKNNLINNPGLEVLASSAERTFITTLKVSENPGNRRIVDTVIWNNRQSVLEFVRLFKKIIPEPGCNSFRFGGIVSTAEVDKFLDGCLNFYNIFVSNQSSAFVDEHFTVERDQIKELLFDEFPRQFVQFIATNIEAEISEHVSFLMKVEEMGLTRIVELLLLHRPIYMIDEAQGILHPYIYELLNKYKLPICNLDIEPRGIERIVEYFTENEEIDGVGEVIALLKRL